MKILLGTDGSSHALAAAQFLAHRIPGSETRVDLVRVASPSRRRRGGRERRYQAPEPGEGLDAWLDQSEWPLTMKGFDVRKLTRWGVPAHVLTELAMDGDYDLVVVGAKGRSETPFHDVGSVALSVLEHVPAPVLVVRNEGEGRSRTSRPGQHKVPFRVLVPTDGRAYSHEAVRTFLSHFRCFGVELVVASAVANLPGELIERLPDSEAQRIMRHWEEVTEAHLKEMVEEIEPSGLPVRVRRLHGPPGRSILEAAREDPVDLIVMGSRPVHDPQVRHLGGVGGHVARSAPCTVFVVRKRDRIAKSSDRGLPTLSSLRTSETSEARKGA